MDMTPIGRLAMVILHTAEKAGASKIRISLVSGTDGEALRLTLGDPPDEAEIAPPPVDLFRPLLDKFLELAGVRRWPWTKAVSGKPLKIDIEGEPCEWLVASTDLGRSMVLSKRRPATGN